MTNHAEADVNPTPDDYDAKAISARIREARLARGWTQLQLALEAHVSPGTIQRWEGGNAPPYRQLVRLANEVFNIDPAAFVETTERGDRLEALQLAVSRLEERLETLIGLVERLERDAERRLGGRARR